MTDAVLIQMHFLTVGSKQKNKNEGTEYHSIFRPSLKVKSTEEKGVLFFSCLARGV